MRYEGFTVKMALADALPVLFFCGSLLLLSRIFSSTMFCSGAVFTVLAGLSKVLWKLFLGFKGRDVKLINRMFVPLMTAGFGLMVAAIIINRSHINISRLPGAILPFPQVVFFTLGAAALLVMIVLSVRFDRRSKGHNWRAQLVNTVLQAAIFLGLLFTVI